MATKKIQNFVKSKVSAHSNISIPFSKPRYKTDSQEELLIFENLESDKEEIVNDDGLVNLGNTNNSNDVDDNLNVHDVDIKTVEYYDIVGDDQDSKNALRTRVGSIGKSVNTAFRDAHSAINAIMKESVRKKGMRKPSEVTKSRRFGSFGRRKVLSITSRAGQDFPNSVRDTADDLEEADEDDDELGEFVVTERHPEIEESSVMDSDFAPLPALIEENNDSNIYTENVTSVELIEENVTEFNDNNVEVIQPLNFANLKMFGAIGAFILMFFIFSISKFILGLLCGVLMSFGMFKIYESFFASLNEVPAINQKYPNLRDLVSPVIPHIEELDLTDEYASPKASFSSWVNAVNSYHPSWYNIAATYSLHVSLEGTKLRMRKPKGKVPSRAMWNDSKFSGLTMVSERTVELLHAKVHLLPFGLVRRRMWSKKYPICITITKNTDEKNLKPTVVISKTNEHNSQELNSGVENFFFFTRTCREKEEIFRRLMAASLGMPINMTISDIVDKYLSKEVAINLPVPLVHAQDLKEADGTGKAKEESSVTKQRSNLKINSNIKEPQIVTYVRYMAKFMPSDTLLLKAKSHHIDLNYISCESELLWLNALLGRVAWDVFRGGHWIKVIREKIQRKLKKLHLPYFIDQLEINDIDLGTELPVIRKVSRPYLDYRGLWVEFEVVYAGGFSMGLETKMNLMKLKNVANQQKSTSNKAQKSECSVKYNTESDTVQADPNNAHNNDIDVDIGSTDLSVDAKMHLNMTTGGGAVNTEDDDEKGALSSDDSFASTSDSELSGDKPPSLSHSSSNKSFLQWVDKIARSSYFQKAADNKYVLRTMEYVSNTSLQLQVDAQYLNGTLVINIPPPPSDRLWWGFKKSPQLNIKARPKVGQKEIQMTKLVEFIEKKLVQEFHRAAVLPNMDDIAIPLLLNGNPDKYSQALL